MASLLAMDTRERIVNVLHEASPTIRLCFNTAPDNTADALGRWIAPRP